MSARENILKRLHAVKPAGTAPASDRKPPLPSRFVADRKEALTAVFVRQASDCGCVVQVTGSQLELADIILSLNQRTRLQVSDPRLLEEFPAIEHADSGNQCTLVRADAAIAETGTLCLHSARVASRSLFLCDELVVLLDRRDIVRYQEDYWRTCRDPLPRATHLITGPSRTADVEQTIQIGAHGPGTLTVIVTDGNP